MLIIIICLSLTIMGQMLLISRKILKRLFIFKVMPNLNANIVEANFYQIISYITTFKRVVRVITLLSQFILVLLL